MHDRKLVEKLTDAIFNLCSTCHVFNSYSRRKLDQTPGITTMSQMSFVSPSKHYHYENMQWHSYKWFRRFNEQLK